jgi:N-acetylmuramoyl-L-alanine amidase
MKTKPNYKLVVIVSLAALATLIFFSFSRASIASAQQSKPVVVISPGHGILGDDGVTIDPGAVYNGLIEKDINLEVAKYAEGFLKRCPVDVYLTREGDDDQHTLIQIAQIVQSYNPTVAVAIHANSGSQSGTEGWYTEGGYDDANSLLLAKALAESVSAQVGINDLGTIPDSRSRFGKLYIRDWKVPSAIIELAYLQKDYELLENNQEDFGRAVARAILEYLNISPLCADNAVAQGVFAATYFPADKGNNTIKILNDGVIPWRQREYALKSIGDSRGAESSYPIPGDITAGEIAKWQIPITAPITPGVYRQIWQIQRGEEKVGSEVTVYMVVVPQQAKDLKEKIDNFTFR